MSVATNDGAWISAIKVVRIDCSECGVVETMKYPQSDNQIYELIREHAKKHNGIDRPGNG